MSDSFRPFSEHPLPAWLQIFASSPNAEERYRALQAVISLGEPNETLGRITSGLDDADSGVRAGTARWLASRASQTPRPGTANDWTAVQSRWQKLLADDDPDVRFESSRGLLHLDSHHAFAAQTLLALLNDVETQPVMHAAILQNLSETGAALSGDDCVWPNFLQHQQAAVREQAARAIGACCGKDGERLAVALLPLLDDEEPFVREEAARSLGRLGIATPEIAAALQSGTADEDEIAAAAARAALEALG